MMTVALVIIAIACIPFALNVLCSIIILALNLLDMFKEIVK